MKARDGGWLREDELRVGLGCMRLPSDASAFDTIGAAAAAGVTVFDTAHAYGPAAEPGANERVVAQALRVAGIADSARIVTKGGMTRVGTRWVADGRARTLLRQCEAGLDALGGLPIDLYLIHAPDPSTDWRTSLRALRRLVDEKLVRRVGVSNVTARRLEEALEAAPITAVQIGLSVFDDTAVRGGVLELCEQRGLTLIAHSPLGGPRRRAALAGSQVLRQIAGEMGGSPAQVALAWVLDLSPAVVVIPGARTPEAARTAAAAARLRLEAPQRRRVAEAFGLSRAPRRDPARSSRTGAEVVLIMGIPGAGKSRLAVEYEDRGYVRLNRDARGGTLTELAEAAGVQLAAGVRRLVLDNTYLTRAARSRVLDVAAREGAEVRCLWLDTSLAQAQANLVERVLDRFGTLPSPEALRAAARTEPGLHTPTSQMRTVRELEPPSPDEGFAAIERRDFVRSPRRGADGSAVFVAAAAVRAEADLDGADPGLPYLLFDWMPDAPPAALDALATRLSSRVGGTVATAVCPHGGGPPACWCRPPLPGLLLEFARALGVDPARSTLIGTTATHRALAASIGSRYVQGGSR